MRAAVVVAAALLALALASSAPACCRREHLVPDGMAPGEAPLAIGDSVMLGAAPQLAGGGLEVDAKEGRVMHAALEIMRRRRHIHTLPDTIVVAIGTNIPVTAGELTRALRIAGAARIVVLVTPLRGWRPFATEPMWRAQRLHPDRVLVADWAGAAEQRPDWLWDDGTHLRPAGAAAYARLVRSVIERPRKRG